MRVSPRELKAVRAGGLVSRYAMLGDAAFVVADLPDGGTAGTSVEEPCRLEHWGLVLQGDLTLARSAWPHVRAGDGVLRPARPGAPVPRLIAGRRRRVRAGHRAHRRVARGAPGALGSRSCPAWGRPRLVRARCGWSGAGAARSRSARSRPRRRSWATGCSGARPSARRAATRSRGATCRTGASCSTATWSSTGRVRTSSCSAPATSTTAPAARPATAWRSPTGALVVDYTPMSALDDARVRRAARTVRAYVSSATRRAAEAADSADGVDDADVRAQQTARSQGRRAGLLTSGGRTPARPVQAHRSRSRTACNRSPPMLSREAPLPRRIARG